VRKIEEAITDDADDFVPRIVAEEAYRAGMREGLTQYAWWKDGKQYVGTCGQTLETALKYVK
jgi:hypothetical protein